MKIRHLKSVVVANALGSGAFLLWATVIPSNDVELSQHSNIENWSPSQHLLAERSIPEKRVFNLSEAQARPLFRQTRRPFDPVAEAERDEPDTPIQVIAAPEPPPAYDPSRLVLKGVWRWGQKTKALIGSDQSPEGVWLELGATISGWTITSLDLDGATLASGKTDYRLQLYVDNPPN